VEAVVRSASAGGDAVKAEIHVTDFGRKEVAAGLG